MKIVEIAVKRPVTTWMCILTVIVFGFVSYSRLPMDLMPDISYPTLTIKTEWEGVAPEEIEQLITRPIEENVGIVNNLQTITSYSQPGLSIILLEFGWDADMDDTVISVREILDRITLPKGTEKSQILRYNPNLEAIMKVAFATKKVLQTDEEIREEQSQIRTVLEEDVKDDLLTLKGVASVEVRGSTRKNLRIKLDTLKMSSMQLSVTDIYNALNVDNMSFAAGRIEDVNGEYLVRLLSKFTSLGEIENIVIAYRNKIPIRLKEVAQVSIADEKQQEIVKINGVEAVVVELYKASGANTVRVASEIKNKLSTLDKKFASLFTYTIVNDQSVFIDSAIKEVFSSAMWGGLLAIVVLFLFLREFKPTLIIAFAIPLSIIAVFIGMYSLGISLNLMSLGGLALGVGMLVDNSIVVLESIDRMKTERKYVTESGVVNMVQASIEGTKIVSTAVTASTLTTIAVFLPIVFVEGVAGKMFADQAFTVSFALFASLVVALTVNPMLSAVNTQRKRLVNEETGDDIRYRSSRWFYAPENIFGVVGRFFVSVYDTILGKVLSVFHASSKHSSSFVSKILDSITDRFGRHLEWLREHYNSLLIRALENKRNTVIIALSLLLVSFVLVTQLGMELVPDVKRQDFTAIIIPEKDMGKQNVSLILDDIANELISKNIASTVYSTIGEENTGKQTDADSASMFIRLKTYKDIDTSIEKTRTILSQYPGIEFKLQFPQIFDISMPLQVEIYGTNVAELREISNRISDRLTEIKELKDIKVLLQEGKPEISLTFNRDKLAMYGLTVQQISRMLELEIKGDITQSKYTHAGRDIDVRIIGRGEDLQNFQRLDEFFIPIGQERIPLKSIAEIKVQNGPSMISRKGQERVGLITANYSGTSLNAVAEKIQKILNSVQLPEGYRAEVGGQVVEMNKSSKSMQFAILLAIFLVYVVMASQFESFKHPLIILFSIPFALIGVIAALFFTGNTITVISLIGVIVLAGIVVNNGIVLIDYTNHLIRKEHYRVYDAILRAGNTRFRPILMTTLTTVLGLLPMALTGGDGSELRSPLAWTIIGGLISSTLLTLVFIPVVYSLMEKER